MLSANLKELLHTFGLSKSEASTYVVLMDKGPIPARELAIAAGVPQPRVYSIIRTLVEKGFLREVSRRPAKYDAMNPGFVLRSKLSELRENMEAQLAEAEQIFEMRLGTKPPDSSAWISYGRDVWIAEITDMLTRCQQSFAGVFTNVGWVTDEGLLKLLKRVATSKAHVRIIGLKNPSYEEDLEILRDATKAEVRVVPRISTESFAAIDDARVLITLEDGGTGSGRTVSIAANNAHLCHRYKTEFDALWSSAKEANPK